MWEDQKKMPPYGGYDCFPLDLQQKCSAIYALNVASCTTLCLIIELQKKGRKILLTPKPALVSFTKTIKQIIISDIKPSIRPSLQLSGTN